MRQRKIDGSWTLDDLVAGYEESARLHGASTLRGDSRATNAAYDRVAALASEIKRRGAEGEAALVELLESADPSTRIAAAYDLLRTQPARAEAALEGVARGPATLIQLDAEMVLKEWRAGRLKGR